MELSARKAFLAAISEPLHANERFRSLIDLPAASQVTPRVDLYAQTFSSNSVRYEDEDERRYLKPIRRHPGVILALSGEKETLRAGPMQFYRYGTELRAASSRALSRYSWICGPDTEKWQPARAPSPSISAFGHLVLLRRKNKNILLLLGVQKVLSLKPPGKRKRGAYYAPHLKQGAGRHYSLIDAAFEIAQRMIALGVPVELHVPHPEAIPPLGEPGTQERIQFPFKRLQEHFQEAELPAGPRRLKTLNLTSPILT